MKKSQYLVTLYGNSTVSSLIKVVGESIGAVISRSWRTKNLCYFTAEFEPFIIRWESTNLNPKVRRSLAQISDDDYRLLRNMLIKRHISAPTKDEFIAPFL